MRRMLWEMYVPRLKWLAYFFVICAAIEVVFFNNYVGMFGAIYLALVALKLYSWDMQRRALNE